MPTYSPLLKLPFAVGGAGLGTIAAADMRPMFAPPPEVDAVAHWDLGGGASSLIDLLSGRPLAPVGAAPTFDAAGVMITSGGVNGLLTNIADKAANQTIACVAQVPTSADVTSQSTMFFGTLQQTAGGDGKGGGVYVSGTASATKTVISNDRTSGGASQNLNRTVAGLTTGVTWVFMLYSRGAAGRFVYVPGTSDFVSDALAKDGSTRMIGLGNTAYNDATFMYGAKFSEFIVWDRGLSQAEAQAVFARTKERLAYRKGLTLFGA